MCDNYILVGKTPKAVDLMTWAKWFKDDHDKRRVAETFVGNARVSTVFLGVDHSFSGGPPLLFETMVFWDGSEMDGELQRYQTWDEAEAGHARMVERVKAVQPQ